MSGNTGRDALEGHTIGEVLQKGQERSTRNRRACMNVDEARGVSKDRSR